MSRPEEKRLERERQEADRIYAEYRRWIDEGMRTAEEPYLRLAAVLVNGHRQILLTPFTQCD